MIDFQSLWDLAEGDRVEFKAAQGTTGQGAIPGSMWESYSAMANTDGGTIYLGVSETDEGPVVEGIKNIDQIQKAFWNSINNSQVVNTNILRSQDVTVITENDKHVLSINVPRASRSAKPVYVKSNPFTGTYRRNYERDYRCDENTVKRMIAEAHEPARDSRLFPNYTLEDLDAESLRLFRQIFTNTRANHPFLVDADQEMLRQLGGWRKDRESGEEGLTGAGLLMFGKLTSILEAFSHYNLDYRELPSSQEEQSQQKWLDRIHTDGSWSGNLFSFYRRVYDRLTEELKVPYRVSEKGQRIDQSPVHEALREALVNTLIHADFSARTAILVTKKSGEFQFTNPGNLRLPLEVVVAGGNSDCRNPALQKMFQMIGAAEQAGSGIPKIWGAWKAQHWRSPSLVESNEPEFTRLTLPMISLLPDAEMALLSEQFGEKFDRLNEAEKLAVVTAQMEGTIYNRRLRELIDMHPTDCSVVFKNLVENGFLEPERAGRWTTYHIAEPISSNSGIPELNSGISTPSSGIFTDNELAPPTSSAENEDLSAQEKQRLMKLSSVVRSTKRVSRPTVRSIIIHLCEDEYRTAKLLEELLSRPSLRRNYLMKMVDDGDLELKHPRMLNNPNQAYKSTARAIVTLKEEPLTLFP